VRRTILTLAAVLAATAAHAQNTVYPLNKPLVIDPEAGLPLYQRKFMPPGGSLDWLPDGARMVATIKPPPPVEPMLEPVVMNGGKGGNIMEHQTKFWTLKQQGATVKMYAGCWSACTLITAYIPKAGCASPKARLWPSTARKAPTANQGWRLRSRCTRSIPPKSGNGSTATVARTK
jgi:hypothetical protein